MPRPKRTQEVVRVHVTLPADLWSFARPFISTGITPTGKLPQGKVNQLFERLLRDELQRRADSVAQIFPEKGTRDESTN